VKDDDDWGLPFHPICFEIFKKISKERLGRVDVHGLWEWRSVGSNIPKTNLTINANSKYQLDCMYASFFENFPREFAAKNVLQQWWQHERGTEHLVVNSVEVPGLSLLLNSCHRETTFRGPRKEAATT
jgi:hypothetical protein